MAKKRTVMTIGDLTVKHFGKALRIPDLHQPGEDFDVKVTVVGILRGLSISQYGWLWVDVGRSKSGPRLLDRPLPTAHPCYLTSEDPPAEPEPVAVAFDEMEM